MFPATMAFILRQKIYSNALHSLAFTPVNELSKDDDASDAMHATLPARHYGS